jgi:predicted ATP-dependent endonuclease of OLD family
MIKIKKARVQRYRSINDMTLEFDVSGNMVSICGQNNVGKTNTLRAINLFFNPNDFESQSDIPEVKKATWGGAVHPKITLDLYDEEEDCVYIVSRDLKPTSDGTDSLSGFIKKSKQNLTGKQIENLIDTIGFFYMESINLIVPDIIKDISNEMISLEYDKSRFSNKKKALKASYLNYIDGLQAVLDDFSENISSTFKGFRDNWSVKFVVPKNADRFRDLISDDVGITIDDMGSIGIVGKGSGLQRLALLLLQFEVIERLVHKKSTIILVDEPDIFLHEGLQKKLKGFFQTKSSSMQIIFTTHSRIFIDSYNMKNVFLLEAESTTQYIKRIDKDIQVVKTYKVDVNQEEGYRKICEHLGIEEANYEMLEKNNVIVEGGCDKKYFSELIKYFGLPEVNIIVAGGADNIINHLKFYNAYYKDRADYCPRICIILDNDSKGREVYLKIRNKEFSGIQIEVIMLPNYLGEVPSESEIQKCKTNNEIEDFIYPELFCYLVNKLLKKKDMQLVNGKEICKQIQTNSFKNRGILSLCEHKKNKKNPEMGVNISFTSSDNSSNQVKEGLARIFSLEGNKEIIDLIQKHDSNYPEVRKFLEKITNEGTQP